eukprot:569799-Alexandrium_andersonii.AAC.1
MVTESAPSSRHPSSAAPLSRQTSGPIDRATAATTTMESDLPELREADIGGIDADDDAGLAITNTTLPGKQGACCKFPELVCADDVPAVAQDTLRATICDREMVLRGIRREIDLLAEFDAYECRPVEESYGQH